MKVDGNCKHFKRMSRSPKETKDVGKQRNNTTGTRICQAYFLEMKIKEEVQEEEKQNNRRRNLSLETNRVFMLYTYVYTCYIQQSNVMLCTCLISYYYEISALNKLCL